MKTTDIEELREKKKEFERDLYEYILKKACEFEDGYGYTVSEISVDIQEFARVGDSGKVEKVCIVRRVRSVIELGL